MVNLADKLAMKAAKIFNKVAPDLLNILRSEFTDDDSGGQSKTEGKVHRWQIPCIVEARNSSRLDEGGRWRSYAKLTVKIPAVYQGAAIDIEITDILQIVKRGLRSEQRLKILSIAKNVFLEMDCEEDMRAGMRGE